MTRNLILSSMLSLMLLNAHCIQAQTIETPIGEKLTGNIIGTELSADYDNYGQSTTTANTKDMAFDGNYDTFFASFERSRTWVGLDLGTPHVVTSVGWSPRLDHEYRVKLGMFEGANQADFSDAIPLYIIPDDGIERTMQYARVDCSRGVRYVRYVGPNDMRCNIAELSFYGHEGVGDDSHLVQLTNLPTVVVNIKDGAEVVEKKTQLDCIVSIISKDGTDILTDSATIRGRGNYSWEQPKKPYRIKFNKKHHVVDSPAKDKKWTLINNYGDKTLMRNVIAFEISRQMGMTYTPYCQPVDVVVNGEYRGCYQLSDQVEVGKNRVDIEKMEPTDIEGDALTGGYFVEVDAHAYEEASWFNSDRGNPVTIKHPDEDDITTEQYDYISQYFQTMEDALFSSRLFYSDNGYRRYLDLDSFLRHFLTCETAGNTDTYWSLFMSKQRGEEQFRVGPCWDLDLSFNNDNRTFPICDHDDFVTMYYTDSYAGNMHDFVSRIIQTDTLAQRRMSQLWSEARDRGLTAEHLCQMADSMATELQQSQDLNFKRWDIMNEYVHQNPQLPGSYEGEVEVIKDYINERIPWMDNKVGYTVGSSVASISHQDGMVYANGESVMLYGYAEGTPYRILSIDGRQMASGRILRWGHSVALARGIYIICIAGERHKIAVDR